MDWLMIGRGKDGFLNWVNRFLDREGVEGQSGA